MLVTLGSQRVNNQLDNYVVVQIFPWLQTSLNFVFPLVLYSLVYHNLE